MIDIEKIIKPDFNKFPIKNYLDKHSKNLLFKEYNLSNFFLFKRIIKSLMINISNRILKNKIYLNKSRSLENVKKKYDQISGTYIHNTEIKNAKFYAELKDGTVVKCKGNIHSYYADIIGKIIKQTKTKSFLEVGAGELTHINKIYNRLKKNNFKIDKSGALDISFKRLLVGKKYLISKKNKIDYIVQGNAAELPFANDSFDLIYTTHCLEQVPNLFVESVNEMLRVAKNYVVLLEPSFELSNKITSNYITYKGYVQINKKLLSNIKYKYFKRIKLPFKQYLNGAELIIYKKKSKKNKRSKVEFICPKNKTVIHKKKGTIGNRDVQYKIDKEIYKLINKENN
ncbi:class I SAM-dependent methyltransferase [Candidatus Pelagibacter ubique]|nr:class I SAM-dependent methyltransferase [Candidatus Pelagibacter ubique]